jgi:Mn2+/Fe2+ NRAMP family transporter
LFALGISEAGLVAAINIAVSTAYTFGEVRRIPHSLNRSYGQAPGFYNVLAGGAVLAAACVLVPHFPLEAVALLVNVIAVLTMPPAIAFLLLLSADEAVVGRRSARASRGALILAWMVGAVVMAAGLWYAASVVWP